MRPASYSRVLDYLQNFSFCLFDLPKFPTSLRGLASQAFALTVRAGFSSITSPEYSAATDEINIGNSSHPYKYITHWTYGTLTLSHGSTLNNTDFNDWVDGVIKGSGERRNFLLVHFTRSSFFPGIGSIGGLDTVAKIFTVPAKAWQLLGCLPTRYKVASDFEALSSDVSIQELDIEPLEVIEVNINSSKSGQKASSIIGNLQTVGIL